MEQPMNEQSKSLENPSDDSPLRRTERSLPIALLRARETVMVSIREMLSKSGLSEQKWRVLRVIEESGPLDQKSLAVRACLLLPSLTRILHAMEKDGLLVRKTDLRDRRISNVSITDMGRGIILEHASKSSKIFSELEKQFGKDRIEQLLDLLEELQKLKL